MAERLRLSGHDQRQRVIASTALDDAPLWQVLAHEADQPVGGSDAFLERLTKPALTRFERHGQAACSRRPVGGGRAAATA